MLLKTFCGIIATGCGRKNCTPSRQQVARDETESLMPLSFSARSGISLPGSACRPARSALRTAAVGRTNTGMPVDRQGLDGDAMHVAPQFRLTASLIIRLIGVLLVFASQCFFKVFGCAAL